MPLNLSRNTRMYISNVSTGVTGKNTFEIPIMDGYSFSQNTESQTVTINEAGDRPTRGQKIFNTALNPVDFSFSTYVRPYYNGTQTEAVEKLLWSALVCKDAITDTAAAALTGAAKALKYSGNYMTVDFEESDVHILTEFVLYFKVDKATYRITKCQLNSAEVDFSIDGIAMINWSGQGETLEDVTEVSGLNSAAWVANAGSATTGTYTPYVEDAHFIANKLTSLSVKNNVGDSSGSVYWRLSSDADSKYSDAFDGTGKSITLESSGSSIGAKTYAALGSPATVGALIVALNTAYSSIGEFRLVDGNIVFTTNEAGSDQTVTLTAETLFTEALSAAGTFDPAIPSNVTQGGNPVAGTSAKITWAGSLSSFDDATVSANTLVINKGGSPVESITITSASTMQEVLDELNDQASLGYFTLNNGDLVYTVLEVGDSGTWTVGTSTLPTALGLATGSVTAGTDPTPLGTALNYTIPITGGSLTIDNGITYLTPEELGVVNKPFRAFTGTRAISGSLNAYLRTGDDGYNNTGSLLKYMTDNLKAAVSTDFSIVLSVGGTSSLEAHVDFDMPHCHLTVPTVDVQDVVSTSIEFTALGQEIDIPNEMTVKYYAP
jgi:hypothetical protein